MNKIKLFENFDANERDVTSVMSNESWAKASKMKAFKFAPKSGNKQRTPMPEDPVYFVVDENENVYTAVIDEKMDHWFAAEGSDKLFYSEEFEKEETVEWTHK